MLKFLMNSIILSYASVSRKNDAFTKKSTLLSQCNAVNGATRKKNGPITIIYSFPRLIIY